MGNPDLESFLTCRVGRGNSKKGGCCTSADWETPKDTSLQCGLRESTESSLKVQRTVCGRGLSQKATEGCRCRLQGNNSSCRDAVYRRWVYSEAFLLHPADPSFL